MEKGQAIRQEQHIFCNRRTHMKVFNYMLPIALAMSLTSCKTMNALSGIPNNEGNGYVIQSSQSSFIRGVTIEYQDANMLKKETMESLDNRYASKEERDRAISAIPKGGQVIVTLEGLTIGSANTEWLEYIVFKDGEEIYRKKGTDKIANVPTGNSSFWWNVDVFSIKPSIKPPFKIVVVNNLKTERTEFDILPPE